MAKTKTIKVWVAVNKNGYVGMYSENEPKRNIDLGKWESKYLFINSAFYEQVLDMVKKVNITWESEPEYFELTYENANN